MMKMMTSGISAIYIVELLIPVSVVVTVVMVSGHRSGKKI
jgi:hypothetical protein